jgi:hypothetical protein
MIQALAAIFPRRDESLRGFAPYLSTTTPATYENQEELSPFQRAVGCAAATESDVTFVTSSLRAPKEYFRPDL